jgi:hypothetical protein
MYDPYELIKPQPPAPSPVDALTADHTSLDLLRAVYRSPAVPLSVRLRAAIAALPHEHPKLAVTANLNGETFADALERAIARSGKADLIRSVRTIEPGETIA